MSGTLWLGLLCGAAAGLWAAEGPDVLRLSLDELMEVNVDKVYGASKFEQEISRAPASVSLVTRDEIMRQGHRTLAEALRSVPGTFVYNDRNYSYLGMRGFNRPGDYNSRILLLVDGHRVNDNIFEQGLYGTEAFLDIDLVERIEVVRGPSSSVHGDNAFLGVVNVITRRGGSINGWETSAEAGENDTYRARVTYGRQFDNGIELLASGTFTDTAGERRIYFPEFDSPASNNGIAENSDEDRAWNFFGSLAWKDFTLGGGYSRRDKNVPTASFFTIFNDGGQRTLDERAYVDLKFDHQFLDELRLITRLAYDSSYYKGDYPYDYGPIGGPPDRVLNRDISTGDWVTFDWQLNWRVADRHTFIFGGDFRDNLSLRQENFDVDPYNSYLNDHRGIRNLGAFAEAELALATNLLLNAGVRLDHYSTFGATLNPRFALVANAWRGSTFKMLYGEAFRAPSAYELFYSLPGLAKANPDLKPENIRTYEVVFEQRLPANLRFSASAYLYQVRNLTAQVTDPGDPRTVYRNLDRAEARGIELELEHRQTNGLLARLSYALQRAEDSQTDTELTNSPRQTAKASLIVPLWRDKVFASAELQYFDRVRTLSGAWTDGILQANLTLFTQRIARGLEVSASIYNLFDDRDGFGASSEFVQDSIPQPGRTFRVKLTYRF